MKLIYLASPFSNESKKIEAFRKAEVTRVAALLHEIYPHAFFLPITQSYELCKYNSNLKGNFDCWKNIDLFMVGDKCDELWVLTLIGWDKSIGVTAEIEHAKQHNKPIYLLSPDTLQLTQLEYEANPNATNKSFFDNYMSKFFKR